MRVSYSILGVELPPAELANHPLRSEAIAAAVAAVRRRAGNFYR